MNEDERVLVMMDNKTCEETGEVRGLLCTRCNQGIGSFDHDPVLLHSAAEYLELSIEALPAENQ